MTRVGEFWDNVFSTGTLEYDWFAGYSVLKRYFENFGLKREHKILNIGCGSSR